MLTTLKTQMALLLANLRSTLKLAETYKRLFNDEPPKGHKTPLDKNDHPELDSSEILEAYVVAKYLTMVGQLQ